MKNMIFSHGNHHIPASKVCCVKELGDNSIFVFVQGIDKPFLFKLGSNENYEKAMSDLNEMVNEWQGAGK